MQFVLSFLILVDFLSFSTAAKFTRGKVIPFKEISVLDILQLGFRVLYSNLRLEPEAYMYASELIEYNDYPVEVHQIITDDGYVIDIFRISGRNRYDNSPPSDLPRSPVILFPEVIFPPEVYIQNIRNESLGFILADAGFDVWLASWRGHAYSRNHVTLDPDGDEYWKFGLDEMGRYDVAGTIRYVHNVTGQKVVTMAEGFGAGIVLIGLATRPEINDMINLNVGLSPTCTMHRSSRHVGSVIFSIDITTAIKVVDGILDGFGIEITKVGFKEPSIIKCILGVPAKFVSGAILATNLVAQMGIYGTGSINVSRIPVYAAHFPHEVSLVLAKQIGLGMMTNEVGPWDWGREENIRRYGTAEPQLYDFKKFTSKYLVLRTFNDIVKDRVDSEDFRSRIPADHDFYYVPDKTWHHMSYIFSTGGKAAVYDYLIDYIRNLESGKPYRNTEL